MKDPPPDPNKGTPEVDVDDAQIEEPKDEALRISSQRLPIARARQASQVWWAKIK